MTMRVLATVSVLTLLAVLSGCSTSTDLTGSAVPNSRPDTRVTGQPPTLLEAGYTVEFNWTGGDPDGRIAGYQWKISDNGVDGISPRDTLTIDPLTGAVINPWHYTTANDSVFYVLADQADFPGDPEDYARSFRTHSFLIRAVDDKGAVDSSPAIITFTSTTIVPTCQARFTENSSTSQLLSVPTTVNLAYAGTDQDFELGTPTHVRFLLTPAYYTDDDGLLQPITGPYYYGLYGQELIDFEDPEWSDWQRYAETREERRVTYEDNPDASYWLFAVQVRDTAGAVSIGKTYGGEILNLRIADNQFFPGVTLNETFLGTTSQDQTSNIPAGQPLNFDWTVDAESAYNGEIVTMRHGWDLADVTDENDPGWAVPPGLTEQNRFAEERSFSNGEHSFWLKVVDDSGAQTVVRWNISITPFVSRENQLNLLVLDQVVDDQTGRWPAQDGSAALDNEDFRNAYYRFLDDVGGIADFTWSRDFVDQTESVDFNYEDLVKYKVTLMFARSGEQELLSTFRPDGEADKFVWLSPYQEKGGNMFLVGSQSMESFLEVKGDYMVPLLFNSPVDTYSGGENTFTIGFGTKELNDGTEILRGPLMYPYATAGITALDWSVPLNKYIYGRTRNRANVDRTVVCSGIKQLKLNESFRANHNIGPGAISEIINTNPEIDWRDPTPAARLDTMLANPQGFPFPGDEFTNGVIADTPTPMIPQSCDGGPNGQCIESMFTGVARFDWIREEVWAYGDDAWPGNTHTANELRTICGDMALTTYVGDDGVQVPLGTARTTGQTYGYFSYKMVEDKPVNLADIYWGFDPYRFDHVETKKAIKWVLIEYLELPEDSGGL